MDKNAIKKYAVWARRELIERVSQKALQYGIAADGKADPHADSVNGHLLSDAEKKQRQALIRKVEEQGYEQTIEEVAYTWFNRFAALRFMEVNGYLPSHVRVFTNEEGEFKPQILSEAIRLDLDGLDMEKVYELKNANKDEELFKYLLIVQCNALNKILPGMFQKIEDYTELLLPDYLLREGSVIQQMIALIPEQDWMDQVQIIGWLYQYYNVELNDVVYDGTMSKSRIPKELLPAATTIYTPDWSVRYMVENSLGRLWLEGHSDSKGKLLPSQEEREAYAENRENPDGKWMYYLEEAEQEADVQKQLDEIRKEYASMKPEEIRCIDPCMGSGHILCYLFDVLVQIYEDYGYTAREAVASIIEKNLWGLDIDERAAQLAYFAVMMKARQYDRRIFSHNIQPHVYAIVESNGIDENCLKYFCDGRPELTEAMHTIVEELHDAKEYGSILTVTEQDWEMLYARFEEIEQDISMQKEAVFGQLLSLVRVAQALAQKYDVVVTNPPYLGNKSMTSKTTLFLQNNYMDSKMDMFAVFIERCNTMLRRNGYQAMITQHSWMFLMSFETLRQKILENTIVNMVHLGSKAFEEIGGEIVQTTSFILQKSHVARYIGSYYRLVDFSSQYLKECAFIKMDKLYETQQSKYQSIPGNPISYWLSAKLINLFETIDLVGSSLSVCSGLSTGDNTKFQRSWGEVAFPNIGFGVSDVEETIYKSEKWYPCNSGGLFRKWSTDDYYVVDWLNNGYAIKHLINSNGKLAARPQNTQKYFKEGLTWNKLSTERLAVKYKPMGYIFDGTANSGFVDDEKQLYYYIGFLCSKVALVYLKALNPTMSYNNGDIARIPIQFDEQCKVTVDAVVKENIEISKADWDSFETSWDFARHPLLPSRDQVAVEQKSGMEDSKRDYTPEETEFAVFCIENVAIRLNVDASEVYDAFTKKTDLLDGYIIPCYDVLHTQGKEYIVNDLVDRLKEKGEGPRRDHLISGQYKRWQQECEDRFQTLKSNEEELNRIFIDIYGLQDELTPEEEDRDVTVRRIFDTKEEIPENMRGGNYAITKRDVVVSLISYAVGCMFGRYSLDVDGLAYAGGEWDGSKYKTFLPDKDAIIPICDDDYFDDDITGRFVQWVETVYGDDTLEENLRFIADAIGGNGTPRQVIRKYFMNDFYADHCKTYQKRPIYWLFDSGKKNGFKCLVYIHRYQPDTIARIRTDYVHEQQSRYRTAIADLEQRMNGASTSERVKLGKQLSKLQGQADETREYEEKIHHLADQMIRIDLDDGVKHNYEIFKDVLAKIK